MIKLVDKKDEIQLNAPKIAHIADLSNYYTKPETDEAIKTAVEAIPEVDLTGYAKITDIPDVSGFATKDDISSVESKIPSLEGYATEQWVEAKGYLTEHQSLENYALRSEIPTKTSDLTNDSGYLTEHQSLAAYSTTTEVQSMIDTAIAGITDGEAVSY